MIGSEQIAIQTLASGSSRAEADRVSARFDSRHSVQALSLKWGLIGLLLGALVFLGWFSFHLAAIRILQVDECGNVFVAKYLASGEAAKLGGAIDLFQCVLSFFERGVTRSIDLFVNARFFMLEIFWLNTVLLALAAGERLASVRGLLALLFAATLAPFWDYGFEARHDNLVLTAVLLTWCSLRIGKPGIQAYWLSGALIVLAQMLASKSFVYTVPIAVIALMFPPPSVAKPRFKLLLAWACGACLAGLALAIAYRTLGLWKGYVEGGRNMAVLAGSSNRFAPWIALGRLPAQVPLLTALCSAGLAVSCAELWRRGRRTLNWDGAAPEAGLLLVALGALFVNPTPYPYNLLHLVPYGFLFAWRRWAPEISRAKWTEAAVAASLGLVIFAHIVPFSTSVRRHESRLNYRQEKLMNLAEEMTDSGKDPVYDATGMVPTRPIVDPRAFLHGLLIQTFLDEKGLRWRELLSANPPAVLIPNYRTDWLPDADHEFVTNHYVPLADDYWVLGKALAAGGGTFEVLHAGRYRISTLKGSDLDGTYSLGLKGLTAPEDPGSITGTVDGRPISSTPIDLAVGTHRLECAADCQAAVVWMGPRLNRVHRIGPGDHRQLFVNWY